MSLGCVGREKMVTVCECGGEIVEKSEWTRERIRQRAVKRGKGVQERAFQGGPMRGVGEAV